MAAVGLWPFIGGRPQWGRIAERQHLSRLFREDFVINPAAYVELTRIDIARRLLEESTTPIKAIAYDAGFGSTMTLRRAFLRRMGVTPIEHRSRFQTTGSGGVHEDESAFILS